MTRFRFSKSLFGLVLVAAGCSDTTPPAAPFTFNRPEHVEFVCIDAAGSSDSSDNPLVLPLRCCSSALNTALFPEANEREAVCKEGSPALHAFVTQGTRGEVAAVDLEAREVLDSDSRIPGYTFVDVGGLPRAIVTPPHMPGNENLGPPWTYVAGAEEQSLRAVATCHFRDGAGCGPEAGRPASEMVIPLPAQPSDMVFGPGNALWLSLPSMSALARIELPTRGTAPFLSKDIQFFRLPVVPDRTPVDAVKDDPEYVSACGLGYLLSLEESEVDMPLTVSALGLGVSSPTRLRFDEGSKLLLVADAKQPFIHALSWEDGKVRVRGQIATGAPIRDFALTSAVPKSAQPPLEFAAADDKPTFGPDEKRYLYAIDDRDGSVLVQSFASTDDAITAIPLRAPDSFSRRDRLALTDAATAIDVVDNRALSDELVCDWGRDTAIDAEIDKAETRVANAESVLSDAQDAYDGAGGVDAPAAVKEAREKAQDDFEERVQEYNKRQAERGILDNAGAGTLRGVFVVVTTLAGRLEVFDVHDLDLYCRGEQWCLPAPADQTALEDSVLSTEEDAEAVAIRRHAHRLSSIASPTLSAADPGLFGPIACEAGKRYAAAIGDLPASAVPAGTPMGAADTGGGTSPGSTKESDVLCVAQDPWLQTTAQFFGQWEGAFAVGWRGQLSVDKDSKQVLTGPLGFDMCSRGVLGKGLEPGYDGDQIVITSVPPSYVDCAPPEEGTVRHLKITKSFADRLEVAEDGGGTFAELMRCYPDVLRFDVRAKDAYMVFPKGTLPPHRIKADASGACLVDDDRDSRLISRARPGELFENAFVSFQLPAAPDKEPARDALIQMLATGANNRFSAPVYLGARENNPSLPVSVRYLSQTGDLYVVDTAQGLRRFTLTPFAADITPFR